MSEIRSAGFDEVASSRLGPAPPTGPGVAGDDFSALQANLNEVRKATWQGDLDGAQQRVERVLAGLSARQRGGARGVEGLQALEGSAQSLLGQILAEREGLGTRARNALERATEVFRLISGQGSDNAQAYADYGAALHLLGRVKEAELVLQQAVKLGDTSPTTGRRLASLLLDDGRAQQAKAVLLPVSTAAPGDVEILALLGQAELELGEDDAARWHLREAAGAALQAGDRERALGLYTAAVDLSPDDPELHSSLGEVLRLLGRMEASARAYDRALAIAPDLLQAKVGKADALRVLGDFGPALALLDDVLVTEPNQAYTLAIKGDILRILGDNDGALAALNASLEEDPASAWTAGTRGQVLRAMGRPAEARSDLERATGAAPEFAWAWAELAATYYDLRDDLGGLQPARHAADQALSRDPGIPLALAVRARCLLADGQPAEAVGPLRALLDVEPTPDWVWIALAAALRATGDDDAARAVVQQAIDQGKAGAEPFLLRAELRLAAGGAAERAAAADDLEHYLRSEPSDGLSLLRAGRVYRALGNHERAAATLERALALNDAPEIRRETAAAEFELRHFDRVLEALDGLTAPPASPEDLWHRGAAAMMLGDQTLADRSFKQALEQEPGYLRALRGLVILNIERQKLGRAREYAARALAERPDDSDVLTTAARVELASQDYHCAFRYLNRALEQDRDNRSALFFYGLGLNDTGRFRQAAGILERLYRQGQGPDSVFQLLGFALENVAVGALTGGSAGLTEDARRQLVRARQVYQEGLDRSEENFYLQRGRADMVSLLDGPQAAHAAYSELVTAVEETPSYNRELIGLLGWCYFRLGRHDEAISTYVSALSAEAGRGAEYLRFDLALATLAADQAGHVRSDYQQARDLCDDVPVPRRQGLFQVARNDLVATIVAGGFRNPSIAGVIVADFDQALRDLEQLDTSRPGDPVAEG
jgi:tetratricopeptide (TPR) repeat protein